MSARGATLLLAAIGALATAACSNSVSDTGYVGSWQRDTLGGVSVVSLRETADGWGVSWHLEADDHQVRCDAEGVCDETVAGEIIYRWRLSAERVPGEASLRLTRAGEAVREGTTPLTEVLRLDLAQDGLSLTAWVESRNGEPLPRPAGPYDYVKISDDPARVRP